MKSVFWKWGFPEHQIFEKSLESFKLQLFERWKIDAVHPKQTRIFSLIPEISDKQKDFIRDVFAHLSIKRVSFQNDKRVYFSLSKLWTKHSLLENETKIADVILYPIQAKEIQDILTQAQQFDISIRTFNQWNEDPIAPFPKNKILGIVNVELMHKVLKFEPNQFQVSIQVGTKLQDLQKYLKEEAWELPFEIYGQEQLNLLEVLQNHEIVQAFIRQIQLHTPTGILIANSKNGFLQQYLEDYTLGIPSEIILKIQPKPKYLRTIEAQLKDYHSFDTLLQHIEHNKIVINSINIINSSSNTIANTLDFFKKPEESSKDIINTFIKKSEEILFKDEIERPIYISLEFEEYHYSISSLLLKVKDLVQQVEGKVISLYLKNKIDDWKTSFPYFENDTAEHQIDCFHYSTLIPTDKMEDYETAILKKLEKNNFYSSKKSDSFIFFSSPSSKVVELHFYFFASTQHRKSEDSFILISEYFQKLLSSGKVEFHQQEKTASINDNLKNSIKNLLDPKGVLSIKNPSPSTFFTKKN